MTSSDKDLAGVLLAAGLSSRFGAPKLLQPLADGQPLVLHAALAMQQVLPDSVVVVRKGDTEIISLLSAAGLKVIQHANAERGMGSSLAVGVKSRAQAAGWLIGLADMPWIQATTWQKLSDTLRAGASLCAPLCQGQRGHPVGFNAKWYAELAGLDGDQGARQLLEEHAVELCLVAVDDVGVTCDVDTPHDLTDPPA